MSYVITHQCDQCGTRSEKVETMSIGAMSGPPSKWQRLGRSEFCSWTCTAKYAAQRAAEETKTP